MPYDYCPRDGLVAPAIWCGRPDLVSRCLPRFGRYYSVTDTEGHDISNNIRMALFTEPDFLRRQLPSRHHVLGVFDAVVFAYLDHAGSHWTRSWTIPGRGLVRIYHGQPSFVRRRFGLVPSRGRLWPRRNGLHHQQVYRTLFDIEPMNASSHLYA